MIMSFKITDEDENNLNWDVVFRIFSTERSFPLFGLMGLPSSLLENTESLISISRDFFKQSSIRASGEAYPVNRRDKLVRAFAQVDAVYGESVSQQLCHWCIRYIVNFQASSSLYAWENLFCYFYRPDDELKLLELIDPSVQIRLRSIIALDQYHKTMAQAEEQLSVLRSAPLTTWEMWLKNQIQYGMADNDTVDLIDCISTDIRLIIGYHHTDKIWERLKNNIVPSEQQNLIKWAHWQAEELGIPDNLIDIALS